MAKIKNKTIRFDSDVEENFNDFRAKASPPFLEEGSDLKINRLVNELVKAQLVDIKNQGGTTILGKHVVIA